MPHWMSDNLVEDHYLYEVLVQTGPMLSHGTESKVQFILTGEEGETQIRNKHSIRSSAFSFKLWKGVSFPWLIEMVVTVVQPVI